MTTKKHYSDEVKKELAKIVVRAIRLHDKISRLDYKLNEIEWMLYALVQRINPPIPPTNQFYLLSELLNKTDK